MTTKCQLRRKGACNPADGCHKSKHKHVPGCPQGEGNAARRRAKAAGLVK